jgi:[acyl-carrier-protein] S-malonyltransferase
VSEVKLACVFPGQGSQWIGMLNAWRGDLVVEAVIEEASDALTLDLWRLVQYGPLASLNHTANTQPVMVAAAVACWRAWADRIRVTPLWSAGHSVGEISALTAAGALGLADAMRLVRVRAQAMAEAVPDGVAGMAAVIGLDDLTVQALCVDCAQGEVLEPVNYNAPGQVVVAGHMGAIERLKQPAKAAGAKMVHVLPVSGPFHSSLMKPAVLALAQHLAPLEIEEPRFRVLHNSRLEAARRQSIKPALAEQLTHPVRWVQTIKRFESDGITHIVEIGPGEVLTNLARRIAPGLRALPLNSPQTLDAVAQALA